MSDHAAYWIRFIERTYKTSEPPPHVIDRYIEYLDIDWYNDCLAEKILEFETFGTPCSTGYVLFAPGVRHVKFIGGGVPHLFFIPRGMRTPRHYCFRSSVSSATVFESLEAARAAAEFVGQGVAVRPFIIPPWGSHT